ncbi:SLC13 family permease [Svornostia abyssi]|uniref:SLC13 family permease n=1 Tax=Svornostia abyssi TaxID=2898438 RepID=A0ABY5PGY1_9ACTN|nr:SLC13 family permease [Parviterribacteraceae bacterium J379]
MDDATITFLVLGGAVALFVWNRLPVGVVAIGVALALYATGVIDVDEAFAGFGDPTVIFIASLFVVSEALDATGITTGAGRRLVEIAGSSGTRLAALLLVLSALLSATLTPNGAVAALVPLTVMIALRLGRAPSELLMPMAFSAHAGALLVLTGSPVNVLVSDEAARVGAGRFGYFEFALVGVPLVIGTVAIAILLGPKLLPKRRPQSMSSDFSGHARTLLAEYAPDERILAEHEVPEELFTRRGGVAEVVVAPRSPLIGEPAFPGMVTPSGDLLVLAVHRQGQDVGPGEVTLAQGDTLLLEGTWEALDEHLTPEEVLVVDQPGDVRRQVVALGPGARPSLAVLAGMVVALASGVVPAAVAGVVAAMALVLLGVLTVEQAHRAISWTTVFLIAGLIPLSGALQSTGAADDIASVMLDVIGDAGGHLLLVALFVVAAAFSVAVSNTATALILIPVGLSAASALDVSPQPVLMSLAVACSASFLTPISTPGNLMVMGPAGYRFGDYWRFGLPLVGLFFVVAVFLVPLVWSF